MIDLNRLTSGKGFKLGQVKLTIAKYYRIDGSSTQRMGVIPDILFPSYVDAKDFGESNEPSALKWDKIESAEYELFFELFLIIPELQKLSKQRRETDLNLNTFVKISKNTKIQLKINLYRLMKM